MNQDHLWRIALILSALSKTLNIWKKKGPKQFLSQVSMGLGLELGMGVEPSPKKRYHPHILFFSS
jgi:hypothetical protein